MEEETVQVGGRRRREEAVRIDSARRYRRRLRASPLAAHDRSPPFHRLQPVSARPFQPGSADVSPFHRGFSRTTSASLHNGDCVLARVW